MKFHPRAGIAATLAGCAFSAGAQTTLTVYGNLDTAVDTTHKRTGSAGTPTGASAALIFPPGSAGTRTRVTQSLSRTNTLGLKGREDLGGGYAAGFVLESQPGSDDGTLSQDGRFFGKQAMVYLTTPAGEVRLGRQYAPIFYTFATNTADALGGTDLFTAGLVTNTLQIRQDNQISYWVRSGGFAAALAYSPNAGVARVVSPARGSAATAATGSMLGAANAGAEASSTESGGKRGRSGGLFLAYTSPTFSASAGVHYNEFGVPVLSQGGSVFELDRYWGFALSAKYSLSVEGPSLHAMAHVGRYFDGNALNLPGQPPLQLPSAGGFDPKLQTVVIGARLPVGNLVWIGEAGESRFTNFTRGKNLGLMLGVDYALSKRTVLYSRLAVAEDQQGRVLPIVGVTASGPRPIPVAGGPDAILAALGLRETPAFNGVGISPDGRSSILALGIRHSF
ncbi:porin [Roseateles sp. DC23W]|uniref:Porin n=1 Tax=Pelomonas dachongensis TaxID=3299029 RepID=A0ABW7ELR3_9BURK